MPKEINDHSLPLLSIYREASETKRNSVNKEVICHDGQSYGKITKWFYQRFFGFTSWVKRDQTQISIF